LKGNRKSKRAGGDNTEPSISRRLNFSDQESGPAKDAGGRKAEKKTILLGPKDQKDD